MLRAALAKLLSAVEASVHVTPVTRNRSIAVDWLTRFESGTSLPGKRAMIKVKHVRTAECVVPGFRWHKGGKDAAGSRLLGLRRQRRAPARRRHLVVYDGNAQKRDEDHPWREWAGTAAESSRMPGAQSRWSAGKDLSGEPLKIKRVCEVKYDHMQGDRFRQAVSNDRPGGL